MLNDPHHGGTHLPDVTLITPVFISGESKPAFYVANRAHQADIGGITPGSVPPLSQTIHEEGVLINDFQLVAAGVFQEKALIELLISGPYPVRHVKQNIADLKAQIAANQKGVVELQKLVDHYGLEGVRAYMHHVTVNAENCVRQLIPRLKPGQFTYPFDQGGQIQVAVRVMESFA